MWAQSAVEIGRIIATARRHHKMTQAQLARALGTTQGWISEVEQGKDTAQIGKVLRALSHLGVRLRTGVVPWYEPAMTDAPDAVRDEPVSLARIIGQLSQPVRQANELPQPRKRPARKTRPAASKGSSSSGPANRSGGARRSIAGRTKK